MNTEQPNTSAFDLRPHLEFVQAHKDRFQVAIAKLLTRQTQQEFTATIEVNPKNNYPQYKGSFITSLLNCMPESLVAFSDLQEVLSFSVIGKPILSEDGNFTGKCEWLSPQEYPKEEYEVLVGVSDGKTISQTLIPEHFTDDPEAIWIYQTHVFLHEFFHTIEVNKRTFEQRSAMQFSYEGQTFNFQQWLDEFEALLLSGQEPESVSYYASVYKGKLNSTYKNQDPKGYTTALMEQICETFVAYQLNIISNPNRWTNFKEAANQKWTLMNRICQAEALK